MLKLTLFLYCCDCHAAGWCQGSRGSDVFILLRTVRSVRRCCSEVLFKMYSCYQTVCAHCRYYILHFSLCIRYSVEFKICRVKTSELRKVNNYGTVSLCYMCKCSSLSNLYCTCGHIPKTVLAGPK